MKRFISLILFAALLFTFAACSQNENKLSKADQKKIDQISAVFEDYKDDYSEYKHGEIDDYIFYDGDDFYRVDEDSIEEMKSSSDKIGNPASYNEYDGYQIYFYEKSGTVAEANRKSNQAYAKNAYSAYIADLAMDGYVSYPTIEDFTYYYDGSFYSFDGLHVCPDLAGEFVSETYEWKVYTKNNLTWGS